MSQDAILATLTRILSDLLGEDSLVLERGTVREDVSGWDSFNYVNFIVAVEMEYGIKFKVAEVESFPNVGAIADRIAALTAAR
jgi:acyl carrier protein